MLKALHKLFGGRSGAIETAPSARVLPLKDVEDEEIPRYPPFAKGLPVAPLDKILATQAELIEKVRNSLGFTVDDFNRLVLPVIQRYAAFVHLLPASESHHHRGAGGLFRHGLEVAFWATQASESVIFSIEGTPRERRDNEPRWRLASCFSGLLHDVGKPLSDVSITDKDGSITWNPYSESLHDWAYRHGIDRYFIRWRDKRHKRHEQFSLLAWHRIIPAETQEFLSKSGPSIIEAMLEAISGTSVNQPVTKLMLRADQESVSRDLRQSRLDVNEFSYGVPVERYVFDAIRRLVKTGKWKVNEPGAKVWHLNQGVFIAWKQLGDLYDLISQDKIPGIPRDPDTLADILIERGFAVPNTVQEKGERAYYRYWEVLPEMLQEAAGPVKILMLRLESNDLVFTTEPPAAVTGEVVGDVEDAEIEFVDPEEADEDQAEGDAGLNNDMLAAELEAEKALAGLGFGDAMAMLKSTSDIAEEKPEQEDTESTELPKPDASKKGKQQSKPGKARAEKQPQKPEVKEDLSPQDIAKNAPPLANDDPLQALKDVGGGLGDIDFPFDVFNASAETACTDATNLEIPDITEPEKQEEQPKPDFVPQEQNSLQNGDFPIFSDSDEPPSWAIEPLPMLTDTPEQTIPAPDMQHAGKPKELEKDAKTLLSEMLAGYGEASTLLEQAIMPVLEGKTTLGEVLCLMKGQAVILYPEGARSLGAPSEVLSKLSHANAIVPDPIMPGRKVRDFSGVKAIVLVDQLSDAVVAAIKDAEASMGGYQEAFELVSPPGSGVSKNKSAPKQQSRKKTQQQKPEVDAGAGSEQKTKDKSLQRQPKEKQGNVASLVEEQKRKPVHDQEKQNVARLPKREAQPVAPKPKVEHERELGHVEVRERDEPEVREFEPPKAKTNPKDINEEDFLPSGVTPEKALLMLKDMIQKRSGRWLVTPVLEEDGCLVTSVKAFDMIAGENVGISKHILYGLLSRAQRRPLLKKRQGKLYLEVDKA
ncbi:MobH family relaxase [Enterobacter hormaechei]|uniref:TraI n=1 Tax=Enterobacter hormaechei TaxID=158836 RepID=A0A3S7QH09_9ENTR|nr:MobH family relaxase [Enterobacter hormaechei]EHM6514385.1 TraI domain-containing protein [Salmonella enterica subsp. enterica serovar Johannesburg]AXJ99572.1 TraI [Enterobacter hormaechei]AXJ99830.1 TraI [Enterobacter hormaechei]OUK58031.1 conjugal transfer protein TraI [Enterobacter hormaechei]OUK76474.1 conjugal transfer protein TraI [Enterobacter hormaechei]